MILFMLLLRAVAAAASSDDDEEEEEEVKEDDDDADVDWILSSLSGSEFSCNASTDKGERRRCKEGDEGDMLPSMEVGIHDATPVP